MRGIPLKSASSDSGLTSPVVAFILLASFSWSTVAAITWVIANVVAGGGFEAVNLIVVVVGLFWGPVLGFIAGGAHILISFIFGRVMGRLPRDLVASAFGWSTALAIWGLLTFDGSGLATMVGSVVVAAIGAALNFFIVRRNFQRF